MHVPYEVFPEYLVSGEMLMLSWYVNKKVLLKKNIYYSYIEGTYMNK